MRALFALILVILTSITLALPPRAGHAAGIAVSAPEAIIVDGWTGQTLFGKNANVERYPASTVKIMTALVVLQHHVPMQRIVTVNAIAVSYGGSTAGLYVGERITVWNLLHGMLLPSGNDAAVALAEATAGSVNRFVTLMNDEASALHLGHTHYLSPNGFDQWGQVTTARDLATLTRVAMHEKVFSRIVRTRSWTVRANGVVVHHWVNLDQLLWSTSTVDGVKTGTTPGAGACLVSSARHGKRWVITVLMGDTETARFTDGLTLVRVGLQLDPGVPSAD